MLLNTICPYFSHQYLHNTLNKWALVFSYRLPRSGGTVRTLSRGFRMLCGRPGPPFPDGANAGRGSRGDARFRRSATRLRSCHKDRPRRRLGLRRGHTRASGQGRGSGSSAYRRPLLLFACSSSCRGRLRSGADAAPPCHLAGLGRPGFEVVLDLSFFYEPRTSRLSKSSIFFIYAPQVPASSLPSSTGEKDM